MTDRERRMLRKPVGERIRYARLKADLTQQELGERVGVDRIQILKWEGGKYKPRRKARHQLAAATRMPVGFFRHDGHGGSDE